LGKYERPLPEAVFSVEQYVCEMALATSNCETNASHKVSKRPKCQERLLCAIVDAGERRCGVREVRVKKLG